MPHSINREQTADTGLSCLVMLARFHGLPADADHLSHTHADPGKSFAVQEILLAGRSLDLKLRARQSNWVRLAKTPLPAICQHQDGHWFILAGLDGDKVLIQDPLENRPLTLPREIFEAAWNGQIILATRRAGLGGSGGKFDFSWFIPAILKYRRLLGEVLAASFFLQLFALITPLFFQVVIDKVLAHKGLTTLDVLAIGLLGVSLFEVILGGLRTYLFSHTTCCAKNLKKLSSKKYLAEEQYLEMEQARLEMQHDLATNRKRTEELQAAIATIDSRIDQTEKEFKSQTLLQLQEAQQQHAALQQERIKAEQRVLTQKLSAPIPGVVQQLSVHTIGGVVTLAQ